MSPVFVKRALLVTVASSLVAVVVLALVVRGMRASRDAARENVTRYCDAIARELDRAAVESARRLAVVNRFDLTPEQRARAIVRFEQPLTVSVASMSEQGRIGAEGLLHDKFQFCMSARDAERRLIDELDARFQIVGQRFRETRDRATAVEALTELAALARAMDALPLR